MKMRISRLRPKRILVVINFAAGASARNLLSGIFRFINGGHLWTLRLIQSDSELTDESVNRYSAEGFDGVILTIVGPKGVPKSLLVSPRPLVAVDVHDLALERRKTGISFVWNDNVRIGTAGARYLISLGKFNSYAFVPKNTGSLWSDRRCRGFVREIEKHSLPCFVFKSGASADVMADRRNLADWLRRLPKPAAVMAAYDWRATQVMDACAEAGIGIPEQVVLLGVDNDEFLCGLTSPSLSSVQPDQETEGYMAAMELDRLMREGKRGRRRTISCRVKGIVERETTRPAKPAESLVRRALEFINMNAKLPLRVEDVVSHLKVSRRLLELRFRESRDMSVLDAINESRLGEVKRLLKGTRRPIAKIAAECGFTSAAALSHLFTRVNGCSMSDYRSGCAS